MRHSRKDHRWMWARRRRWRRCHLGMYAGSTKQQSKNQSSALVPEEFHHGFLSRLNLTRFQLRKLRLSLDFQSLDTSHVSTSNASQKIRLLLRKRQPSRDATENHESRRGRPILPHLLSGCAALLPTERSARTGHCDHHRPESAVQANARCSTKPLAKNSRLCVQSR